jgi:ribosome-binding factor A
MKRTDRLNSLLKEVITEVIRKDVKNPLVSEFTAASRVDISKDLRHAKVYVSIVGSDEEKKETIKALNSGAGFIAVKSSKKVVMHHFPELIFRLDDSVDKHIKIQKILSEIKDEKNSRSEETQE